MSFENISFMFCVQLACYFAIYCSGIDQAKTDVCGSKRDSF